MRQELTNKEKNDYYYLGKINVGNSDIVEFIAIRNTRRKDEKFISKLEIDLNIGNREGYHIEPIKWLDNDYYKINDNFDLYICIGCWG